MNLIGKKALITGASRGLGKAIAIKLAELGADIVINDIGNEEEAESVVKEIESLGRNSLFIKADISDFEQAKELVDNALKEIGSIDIVVNNAGITRDNLLLRMSEEDFDSVIDVNLKGVMLTCQIFAERMIEQKRPGSIINISSASSTTPLSKVFTYSISKAGINNMTQFLAREFAPHHIRVNAIIPGFFPAEQNKKILSEDRVASIMGHTPMNRFGDPEELKGTAIWLAAEKASSFVTGALIQVDGGFGSMTI